MFGLFLTATVLSFVLIFIMPLSVFTRWLALPVAILAFLNALFTTVASVLATVMFVIFKNTISGVAELNIGAEIGITMFAFMWVASAMTIFAWLFQMGLCCCCASRRDVKKCVVTKETIERGVKPTLVTEAPDEGDSPQAKSA